MTGSEYNVLLVGWCTGIILREDGAWNNQGEGTLSFNPTYSTLEEARESAMRLVEQHPYAECLVRSGDEVLETIINEAVQADVMKEHEAWKKLPWYHKILQRDPRRRLYR